MRNKFFTGTKIYSPPRLIDQFIYFGGCDGVVHKLDPLSGRVVGRHQLPEALTNAIRFDGHSTLFYVLSAANMLHALRPLAAETMTRGPSERPAAG